LFPVCEYGERARGYDRSMISSFQTRSRITDEHSPISASDNARHHAGEIGGRRFRVRYLDGLAPSRFRRKRLNMLVAMLAGWTVAVGVTVYSLVTDTPERNTVAAVCEAGGHPVLAGEAMALTHGPTNFNLNVFNSTNRDALAARTAVQLQSRGFIIDMVSNDPLKSKLTIPAQVWGSKSEMSELRTVAAEVPGAQIMTDGRSDPSVDLILGAGFTALAPTESC
jgi:LytR cell envelope-related transcriptional attenuator